MQKGQSACGVFCLFYINNRRQKQAAMHIPKSALNPWSSRNGNSLVVIAAEHDTWANYSVWEAELISPDAASYWHSYNPSGTWARILLIRHFSLLAASSKISEYYAVLYFLVLLSVQKKKRKKGKKKAKICSYKEESNGKELSKNPRKLWTLICNSSAREEEDAHIHNATSQTTTFEMWISVVWIHYYPQPSESYLKNRFIIMTT